MTEKDKIIQELRQENKALKERLGGAEDKLIRLQRQIRELINKYADYSGVDPKDVPLMKCLYNSAVECRDVTCERCGWNPAVEKERKRKHDR